MIELGIDNQLKESIVRGISGGIIDFLTQRKVFDNELIISSAFAWMKSNYVDSAVAKNIPENVNYEIKKVGAWKYISFEIIQGDAKYKFVMKPPMVFESLKDKNYYLSEDSEVNRNFVESEEFKKMFSISEQTSLSDDLIIPKQLELLEGNKEDRLYIVSYDINQKNGINSIDIFVPFDGNAYHVESLTDMISELGVAIPEELLKSDVDDVRVEEEYFGPDSSKYDTFKIVKSKSSDKD